MTKLPLSLLEFDASWQSSASNFLSYGCGDPGLERKVTCPRAQQSVARKSNNSLTGCSDVQSIVFFFSSCCTPPQGMGAGKGGDNLPVRHRGLFPFKLHLTDIRPPH